MRALAVLLLCPVLAFAADTAPLTVSAGGKPVLTMKLPTGWKSVAKGDVTTLLPPEGAPHVQLWPVADAKTVADVVAKVPSIIEGEVKDFAAASTTELTVAGAPATQLIGTGTEADDGDPANAEVTVFTLKGVVYVLVAHGEGDGTAKRHDDLLHAVASVSAAP